MNYMYLLLLSIVITFFGVIVICLTPSVIKSYVNLSSVCLVAILTSIPAINVILGSELNLIFQCSAFFGPIAIQMDALSAWFVLIINFTCFNGAMYGIGYMKTYQDQKNNLSLHWSMFGIFHLSMILVCVIQHSVAFLIVWEIMSISSMLLVIFDHSHGKNLKAGLNYMVQMHIGIVFLSIAFIWVAVSTGSFNFSAIAICFKLSNHSWLFLLFFIGFGIKAGFIPLHTWLPEAHPVAPSHISGVMSGVIVKLGVFGILRIIGYLNRDFIIIGECILLISIFTGLYGILNASMHRDFKKMLAYCTIENIGIIGMGIGLGLIGIGTGNTLLVFAGFGAALLHVLNHSLFKSLLFFTAGSVYQQTHTKNMEKLGGLFKLMPQTAMLFLFGAIAIGGLPPFNGFVSEFLLYNGFLEGIKEPNFYIIALMVFSVATLAMIGGVSLLTFTKSFGTIFLGQSRSVIKHKPQEVSFLMRFPQYLIILVMLSVAVLPGFYLSGVNKAVTSLLITNSASYNIPSVFAISGIMANIGLYTLLFCGIIAAILAFRYACRKKINTIQPTWGCAYTNANARMQYTGKGFVRPLGKLMGIAIAERKNYKEIKTNEIFPTQRSYFSYYIDIFGIYLYFMRNRLLQFMNYFQFIQNGNMQFYIMYGIFFILIVFLATLFNFI